jgi:hypothetical protein
MLPKVLRDSQIQIFKFWFDGALQDGTHYRNELYYRALSVETHQRMRLYHLACKFAKQGAETLVTLSDNRCSLWISLRSQAIANQVTNKTVPGLPHPKL